MKMKVSFGDLMFQVVVLIIVCLQEIVSGERAQGCVRSRLGLRCSEMKVISVASVVLGYSISAGSSFCYITDNACTRNATANHTMDVHRRCDGQRSCTVDVIREQMITCGNTGSSVANDFERITFNCIDNLQISTTATLPRPNPTEDNLFTEENTKRTETENVLVSSAILGVGIVGAVCLIITIGIVFVVKVRRKKMKQLRSTEAAKTVYVETDEYETIDVNGAQGISIEKPVSEYCELNAVDRARVQRDSHYLQLYEPLVVYNQSP